MVIPLTLSDVVGILPVKGRVPLFFEFHARGKGPHIVTGPRGPLLVPSRQGARIARSCPVTGDLWESVQACLAKASEALQPVGDEAEARQHLAAVQGLPPTALVAALPDLGLLVPAGAVTVYRWEDQAHAVAIHTPASSLGRFCLRS